jgi:hypothetical protein
MCGGALKSVSRMLVLALVATVPAALSAQAGPTAKGKRGDPPPSRWDIFLGYSYLAPNSSHIPGRPTGVPSSTYGQINWGGIGSVAYYFNDHLGLEVEGDGHIQSEDWPAGDNNASFNSNDDFAGGEGGVIYRIPTYRFTPFFHALVGGERVGSLYANDTWGPNVTAGGGLDINLSQHWSIRFGQVDYQYANVLSSGINAYRISTGVVFHAGSVAPPTPVTLSMEANPDSVFPGTPVTITATAGNLNPKLHAIYSYSGNGVTGSGTTATVDTSSLAPGTYTVSGTVKEGKPGKEGQKPWQIAQASTSFTVKEFEPPTISCSANPSTIQPGGTSTITATSVSPQNLPLTYSYSASAGTVTGSGTTAEYSSVGAPTGVVGITCKVSDNKGHTASADTNITIQAPPPPPQPHTQALCSISFTTDKRRPTRVDNEAKACLDQVALDLKQQPNATAVLVGEQTSAENAITQREEARAARYPRRHITVTHYAAQRAVNAKDYLVTEQGIDASRISVATTPTEGQEVQNYLVPSGASFSSDVSGTTPVNESEVKPIARTPLPTRNRRR